MEAITALYRPRAEAYLGEQATEEKLRSVARRARILHFAGHTILDDRFPLNSALALTVPLVPKNGRQSGLLQAWEIYDNLRMAADLVVLSSCGSAMGRPVRGEGLMGLTRAFHYAGARSVVASLWGVSDRSTALLLSSFYRHLRQGLATDMALREAQLGFIRGGAGDSGSRRFTHPFHWAAFVLFGDYRQSGHKSVE